MITLPAVVGRAKNAWNAIKGVPGNPESVRFVPIPVKHAGVVVDHDQALTVSGYFRAVSYISGQIAGLPWDVIRESETRTVKQPAHPAWRLLHRQASREMGPFTWRETLMAWALTWGNGYAEIERDMSGRPLALHPLSPDRVEVKRGYTNGYVFEPDSSGGLVYQVGNPGREKVYLLPDEVFHLHGLGFDGLVGYSIITLAARSLGMAIGAERYAEDFFANGLVSTGGLKHPKTLTQAAHDRLKLWIAKQTEAGGKFQVPIFEEGMEWQKMDIPPEDAQLLETRQLQISEVARWFGLPPHKLAEMSHATFSNIESQSREVVNDCFMPWIHRLEEEANRKLVGERERGVRTKMNVRGLLRGDDTSRANYYLIMRNIGVYSTNDIRRLEDMDPVGPEGDELLVQLNQTTLKRLAAGEPEQNDPESRELMTQPQIRQSYALLLEDAFRRVLRREANRAEQNQHKALTEWIGAFQEQQRDYMRSTLTPVLTSMVMLHSPGQSAKHMACVAPALEVAIDAHLKRMADELENMRPDEPMETELRAKQEATDLIERVFASIAEKGAA